MAVETVRQWNKQSVTFSNAITYLSATPYNSVTCGLGNAQKTWGGANVYGNNATETIISTYKTKNESRTI